MDKSWTLESRVSIAYEEGVKQFLDFAFANAISRDRIKCPCKNCSNVYYRSRGEVYEHLICDGFEKSYARDVWVFHGEIFASPQQTSHNVTLDEDVPDEVDDMHRMLRSAFGIQDPESSSQEPEEEPNAEAVKFYKLIAGPVQYQWMYPIEREHRKKIYTNNRHKRQIDRELMHNDQFPKWFESHRTRNPDGQAPDRIEMFRMTHTRRDGQLVDQASEDVMALGLEQLYSKDMMWCAGARVRLECRERESMEKTYRIDGMTDRTGTYKIPVPDDHENEICEMVLVSSPQMECATAVHHADRARVALTRNNGIVSDTQYANNLGFLKDAPMVGCSQLLKKYQEYDD
ncbi:hypothetical protein AAC387_Pa02g1683 [Persea americana]